MFRKLLGLKEDPPKAPRRRASPGQGAPGTRPPPVASLGMMDPGADPRRGVRPAAKPTNGLAGGAASEGPPSTQVDSFLDEQIVAKALCTEMSDMPQHFGLLTLGAKSVMPIPEDMRNRLTALELGPQRAVMLIEPTLLQTPKGVQLVTELRTRLKGAGFSPSQGGDLTCTRELIERVVNDYAARIEGGGSSAAPRASNSNAAQLFMSWVKTAVREKATDIHARVTASGRGEVQIRVDGELEMLRDGNGGVYTESEVLAAMSYAFNNTAQAGSNSEGAWQPKANLYCMTEPMTVDGHRIALRYQSVTGINGPKVVARVLNVGTEEPTLTYEQLGYELSHRELWMDVSKMSSGMAVLAGVTGSGKTTSLKTFVETHPNNGAAAFFSIEDPVEYLMKGVHQIPLQRSLGDKAASLRSFMQVVEALMRMDPDMVIAGEIRDAASAAAAQTISNTGHMALGTVHAHLISGIIPRMTDEEVGMKRNVLTNPNILSLLAYQALVPKLCPHCALNHREAQDTSLERDRAKKSANGTEAAELSSSLRHLRERFRIDLDQLRFRNLEGCNHCNFRGTKGLTVVAEMMIPDRQWLALTREGRDYEALNSWREKSDRRFMSENMHGKTVFEHCLYKALLGIVDVRRCEAFDTFARFEILGPKGTPIEAATTSMAAV